MGFVDSNKNWGNPISHLVGKTITAIQQVCCRHNSCNEDASLLENESTFSFSALEKSSKREVFVVRCIDGLYWFSSSGHERNCGSCDAIRQKKKKKKKNPIKSTVSNNQNFLFHLTYNPV